jgi:flagellar protein FlbD
MIHLTRLNHQSLTVNSDLIKFIENAPDTVLTLINGEKIVVCESPEEVVQQVIGFRRLLLAGLPCAGTDPNAALAVTRRPEEAPRDDHGAGDKPRG